MKIRIAHNATTFDGCMEISPEETRPPREHEKHEQIMLRTPGSWLRGHTVSVGNRYVNIYRTFFTDKSMTHRQLKDVRSFSKFADAKMNNK